MVVVKGAGVLGERIEEAAERRPCLAVERMGVSGGHHVGTGHVHPGVNGECRLVDRTVAFDHAARLFTRIRSEARIWPKCMPKGFTQK